VDLREIPDAGVPARLKARLFDEGRFDRHHRRGWESVEAGYMPVNARTVWDAGAILG
jgi:hypothetical protein